MYVLRDHVHAAAALLALALSRLVPVSGRVDPEAAVLVLGIGGRIGDGDARQPLGRRAPDSGLGRRLAQRRTWSGAGGRQGEGDDDGFEGAHNGTRCKRDTTRRGMPVAWIRHGCCVGIGQGSMIGRPYATILMFAMLPTIARGQSLHEPTDESRAALVTVRGASVALGLGATRFLEKETRDLTGQDVAFYTDLRLTYGTRTRFAGELAYTRAGRALPLEERRHGAEAIYGHSFEALLRLNHSLDRRALHLAPFAVAGLGWTDFRPGDDREPTTRAVRLDRVGVVPIGLGLAASWRGFYSEARFMYRPTFGENGFGRGTGPSLQAWFAGLAAGVEF